MATTTLPTRGALRNTGLGFLGGRLSRHEVAWPNPELSIGRHIGELGKEFCWEANGPARDAFKTLAPQIKDYLEQAPEPGQPNGALLLRGRGPSQRDEAYHQGKRHPNACPGIKTGHAPQAPGFSQLVQVADDAGVHPPNWYHGRRTWMRPPESA
ncbi:hypothetical protein CDD83_4113 [Cordyceps sp. RAO-2017]|nr:hypothetical protein CDD83_4113 [Cordyceps sp. RAO-2017]